MATQIKPVSSGAYTTITLTPTGGCAKSSTGLTGCYTVWHQAVANHAINVWHNAGGTGSAALRAVKVAKAAGILLQEV
jgi:protein gp37